MPALYDLLPIIDVTGPEIKLWRSGEEVTQSLFMVDENWKVSIGEAEQYPHRPVGNYTPFSSALFEEVNKIARAEIEQQASQWACSEHVSSSNISLRPEDCWGEGSSDPLGDVYYAKQFITNVSGQDPNTLIIEDTAMLRLRRHYDIEGYLSKLQYPPGRTEEVLCAALNIEQLGLVSAGSLDNGSSVVVAYLNLSAKVFRTSSFLHGVRTIIDTNLENDSYTFKVQVGATCASPMLGYRLKVWK